MEHKKNKAAFSRKQRGKRGGSKQGTWKMASTSAANWKRAVPGVPATASLAAPGVASAARPCGAAGACSCSATAPGSKQHTVLTVLLDACTYSTVAICRARNLQSSLPPSPTPEPAQPTLVHLFGQLHAHRGRRAAAAASRLRGAYTGRGEQQWHDICSLVSAYETDAQTRIEALQHPDCSQGIRRWRSGPQPHPPGWRVPQSF